MLLGCKDSTSEAEKEVKLAFLGESEKNPAFDRFEIRNFSSLSYICYMVEDSVLIYEMLVKEGDSWEKYPTYFEGLNTIKVVIKKKSRLSFDVFPPAGKKEYRVGVNLFQSEYSPALQVWSDPVGR